MLFAVYNVDDTYNLRFFFNENTLRAAVKKVIIIADATNAIHIYYYTNNIQTLIMATDMNRGVKRIIHNSKELFEWKRKFEQLTLCELFEIYFRKWICSTESVSLTPLESRHAICILWTNAPEWKLNDSLTDW